MSLFLLLCLLVREVCVTDSSRVNAATVASTAIAAAQWAVSQVIHKCTNVFHIKPYIIYYLWVRKSWLGFLFHTSAVCRRRCERVPAGGSNIYIHASETRRSCCRGSQLSRGRCCYKSCDQFCSRVNGCLWRGEPDHRWDTEEKMMYSNENWVKCLY